MANNLKDHLKEVADAIRAKKGTSDLINPQDFATEIEGISGSGGGESGGSNMEYWDITAASGAIYEIAPFVTLLKYTKSETMYIQSVYGLSKSGITPIAVAIDTSLEHLQNETIKTVGEIFNEVGFPPFDTIGWVRLTKEQFYSLE